MTPAQQLRHLRMALTTLAKDVRYDRNGKPPPGLKDPRYVESGGPPWLCVWCPSENVADPHAQWCPTRRARSALDRAGFKVTR